MIKDVDIMSCDDKYFDAILHDEIGSLIILKHAKILKEPYLKQFRGFEIDILVLCIIELTVRYELNHGSNKGVDILC